MVFNIDNVTLWCWIEIEAVPKTNIQWLWDHHTCIIPFLEGNSTIVRCMQLKYFHINHKHANMHPIDKDVHQGYFGMYF